MQMKLFSSFCFSHRAILKGVTASYTNGFGIMLKIKTSIVHTEFLVLNAGSAGVSPHQNNTVKVLPVSLATAVT